MIFSDLDIGDYFVHWDIYDGGYDMFRKESEYNAKYLDKKLDVYGDNTFSSDEIVYKVIV